MIALLVPILMAAGCLGTGMLILRLTGGLHRMPPLERAAFAFALGFGALGWLAFWAALAGLAAPLPLALLCLGGLPFLMLVRQPGPATPPREPWTLATKALAVGFALSVAATLAAGLAPPSDADSLAYHFAIPRLWLAEGRLVFVPRAADGAVPLLPQATTMVALALGGERAVTLWCALTGWAAVLAVFVAARRWLGRDWALAIALAVATTPAFVYGAAGGQVEPRMMMLATVAMLAVLDARARHHRGAAVVAGLAAGALAACKYPGLLVVALAGLALLLHRRGLMLASLFTVAVLAAGSQWYGWNMVHTGDPFFPVLWGVLPHPPALPWNDAQQAAFKHWAATLESPLPRTLDGFLTYPLAMTLNAPDTVDAGRTGLGPLGLLLLPFALAGAWRFRARLAASPLLVPVLACMGFYGAWYWFGASQRVRHFLPLLPLLLVALAVAAERVTRGAPARLPLLAALAATLVIQLGGQALFARVFLPAALGLESRDAYYDRTVPRAFAARWVNANLPRDAVVLTDIRQLLWLLDRRSVLAHSRQAAEIEVREGEADLPRFLRQIEAVGITHLLLVYDADQGLHEPALLGFMELAGQVVDHGCGRATVLDGPPVPASRTLGGSGKPSHAVVVELVPDCR